MSLQLLRWVGKSIQNQIKFTENVYLKQWPRNVPSSERMYCADMPGFCRPSHKYKVQLVVIYTYGSKIIYGSITRIEFLDFGLPWLLRYIAAVHKN